MGRGPSFVLVVVCLLAPALAAGCLGADGSPVEVVPYLPLNDAEPGRATQFAFFVRSLNQFRQELPVSVQGLPEGWTFEPEVETMDLLGSGTTSLIVTITPSEDAAFGPHDVHVLVGERAAKVTVNVGDLGDEPLRRGIGTQLYYVGWYDNGTLFGFNEPSVHGRGIPHFPPGGPDPNATENDTSNATPPLKVYVGGERGTPPPEPYNSTGYSPVIPGFDSRLRNAENGTGMVEDETLAVRIAKERAYTYAGNQNHVLYGENLNFLIRIVSVDELQARPCDLPVCPA